ncbi:GIY-YIG nuclease family protein [Aureimonas psammosilenae]|uniref:hypothetical protein n=1 Tax=Aureimonas psammosilenae TaxID=2495496 RepID=UPI001260C37B|nr:hypothetical protein [Aureimonas psammosilenae]
MMDGFAEYGRFVLEGSTVRLDESQPLPTGWSVYAFRRGGEWTYVGSAKRTRARLQGYLRHQRRGSQSRYVHASLAEALVAGPIAVFVLPFADPVAEVDGLPLHMPLGVEAGLIHRLNPPWNRRGLDAAGGAPIVEDEP